MAKQLLYHVHAVAFRTANGMHHAPAWGTCDVVAIHAVAGNGNFFITVTNGDPHDVNKTNKPARIAERAVRSVTLFSDKDFKGGSARLTSGQQVKDINKELGFVQSIDSLRADRTA